MSIPSKDLDCQRHMSCSIFCVQLLEVRSAYSFIDSGGIVDHHCLNFLFIYFFIKSTLTKSYIELYQNYMNSIYHI